MAAKSEMPMSPTVVRVLEEYVDALRNDDDFDNQCAQNLEKLLKQGRIPKAEELDAALLTPKMES